MGLDACAPLRWLNLPQLVGPALQKLCEQCLVLSHPDVSADCTQLCIKLARARPASLVLQYRPSVFFLLTTPTLTAEPTFCRHGQPCVVLETPAQLEQAGLFAGFSLAQLAQMAGPHALELKPYQHATLAFLAALLQRSVHGAVLVREGALGARATLSVWLATLAASNSQPMRVPQGASSPDRTALHLTSVVVAPTEHLPAWRAALRRWAPRARLATLTASARANHIDSYASTAAAEMAALAQRGVRGHDLVLTTPEALCSSGGAPLQALASMCWLAVLVDGAAQMPRADFAALRPLLAQAQLRVALEDGALRCAEFPERSPEGTLTPPDAAAAGGGPLASTVTASDSPFNSKHAVAAAVEGRSEAFVAADAAARGAAAGLRNLAELVQSEVYDARGAVSLATCATAEAEQVRQLWSRVMCLLRGCALQVFGTTRHAALCHPPCSDAVARGLCRNQCAVTQACPASHACLKGWLPVQSEADRLRETLAPYTLQLRAHTACRQWAQRQHAVRATAMPQHQATVYGHYAHDLAQQVGATPEHGQAAAQHAAGKAPPQQQHGGAAEQQDAQGSTLAAFMALYRAAQHPLLVRARYSDADLHVIAQSLTAMRMGQPPVTPDSLRNCPDLRLHAVCHQSWGLHHLALPPDAFFEAAKVTALQRQLYASPPGPDNAVIIASNFSPMLDILEHALAVAGIPRVRIDSATSPAAAHDAALMYDAGGVHMALVQQEAALRVPGLALERTALCIYHDSGISAQVQLALARVHWCYLLCCCSARTVFSSKQRWEVVLLSCAPSDCNADHP